MRHRKLLISGAENGYLVVAVGIEPRRNNAQDQEVRIPTP